MEHLRNKQRPDRVATMVAGVDRARLLNREPADQPLRLALADLPDHLRPAQIWPAPALAYFLTGDTWAPVVATLLAAARRSIKLAAYSVSARWPDGPRGQWAPWPKMLAAPARGVTCQAVLANPAKQNRNKAWNNRAAAHLASAGWRVRRFSASRLLHAKTWIIDDAAYIVGSHNISQSAAAANHDASILMIAPQGADRILHWWNSTWAGARA